MPTLVFVRSIDYRTPLKDVVKELKAIPANPKIINGSSGTLTQNMPLFHRSSRDFSEYANGGPDSGLDELKSVLGGMFGNACDMMLACLKSGLLYEKGETAEAHKLALAANSLMRGDHRPELKFCVMNMLANVLNAMGQQDKAFDVYRRTEEMIESDKAYYLSYNFHSCLYRAKIEAGDTGAAREWLDKYGASMFEDMAFYRIYGCFTAARANIALGEYDDAIIAMEKIAAMCGRYRRPLDTIEANILISIAYWKKKRGFQDEAVCYMEKAAREAYPYGYTQLFAGEGGNVVNILHKLGLKVSLRITAAACRQATSNAFATSPCRDSAPRAGHPKRAAASPHSQINKKLLWSCCAEAKATRA
jgi:tetratricopeptide (TPR) repeat protein